MRDESHGGFIWVLCLRLTRRDTQGLAEFVKHLEKLVRGKGPLGVWGGYLERSDDAFKNGHASGAGTDASRAYGEFCGIFPHLFAHRER